MSGKALVWLFYATGIWTILGSSACKNNQRFQGHDQERPPQPEPVVYTQPASSHSVQPTITPIPQPNITPPAANSTVTRQGSFIAWAEPERPRRYQNYYLNILINLPDVLANYSEQDLDGQIIGTDGYIQGFGRSNGVRNPLFAPPPIGGWPKEFLVNGNQAILKLQVPGAAIPATLDTIEIFSTLLNERQSLSVRFP
jgi:hypothetical protein